MLSVSQLVVQMEVDHGEGKRAAGEMNMEGEREQQAERGWGP